MDTPNRQCQHLPTMPWETFRPSNKAGLLATYVGETKKEDTDDHHPLRHPDDLLVITDDGLGGDLLDRLNRGNSQDWLFIEEPITTFGSCSVIINIWEYQRFIVKIIHIPTSQSFQ